MLSETLYSANTPVSSYQPSKEISDFTKLVKDDYSQGVEILNKPWVELNDLSVIERMNRDQRTFNAFVDENIEDPKEAWKWRGTRSKARNKAIAMHAQLTAGYIIPMFMAQNENDEEDRDFSDCMRDIAEWMVENSDYKQSFLTTAMMMLVNPVTYMGAEYAQVYQTVKEKTESGWSKKEILDEVHSGFKAPVYSADEILITNAHVQPIQRQRAIVKRRYIDYSDAKAKYGDHENFEFVKPGQKSIYSSDEGLFYDVKDDAHPTLVEECTHLNRRDDSGVCFIGGIYLGDSDVEHNPIKHRDNRGAPKYNVIPFGYQRINEHFFYYKSLMNSLHWDNQLLDAQYEIGMNRLFLETEMPIIISGAEKVDSDIVFPGAVTSFSSPDVKSTPAIPQSNIGNLFAGMSQSEKSIDEATVSDVTGGQLPSGDQKATGIAIAERNAKTLLKGVGNSLGISITEYGGLMSDIAVNHLTVPQVAEVAGVQGKMKYPTFILDNKQVKGKNVSKVLRFDDSLLGAEMTDEEKEKAEISLAEESGYPNDDKSIYRINPELFRRMKYLTKVEPSVMFPKNEEYQQAMYSQIYNQFAPNPFVSLEALTRKTLYQYFRGETEDVMQKPEEVMPPMPGAETPTPAGGSMAGNVAVNKGLSSGMTGVL